MAKGPVITENIRQEMAKIYVAHPDWRAKEVENELKEKLKEKAPGLSSIQKELKRIRVREDERSPEEENLNRTWTIGDLTKHELGPEAVRLLLLIQNERKREGRTLLKVREALWVARLYAVREIGPIKQPMPLDLLATWGEAYALREKVCTISNTICDTSDLDEGLLGNFGQALENRVIKIAEEAINKLEKSRRLEDAQEYLSDETVLTHIKALEFQYFGYALGNPDMDSSSLATYKTIIKDFAEDTKDSLKNLGTEERKVFFLSLRKWVKDNNSALRQLDGKADKDDPRWDRLFEGIDRATAGIIREIKAKTPQSEIPINAQKYFESAWTGKTV
jgi:hypothetical protein